LARAPRQTETKARQTQAWPKVGPEVSILMRSGVVAKRREFGHWECDLIQFRKTYENASVTSLVKRVSRFAVFSHNNDHQSKRFMDRLVKVLEALPFKARRSITFDRGTEFTD
jgi:transposase, IS30 family